MINKILLCFYIMLLCLFYVNIKEKIFFIKDCISLIVPATEEDFFKCYKQFFYFSESYISAKEIIIAVSSVKNSSKFNNLHINKKIRKKIIFGFRKQKHNAASNRNFGFSLSSCKIVSFTDIDDIMSTNRLNILYKFLTEHKTTEFVIHKYSTTCSMLNNNVDVKTNDIEYNLSYQKIYESYKMKSRNDKPNRRFCCKYIPEIRMESIHNGWPTMRRYVMLNIKYNESFSSGQDSDFNANVILKGYNTSILNISLGYYIKDNKCLNYYSCH